MSPLGPEYLDYDAIGLAQLGELRFDPADPDTQQRRLLPWADRRAAMAS